MYKFSNSIFVDFLRNNAFIVLIIFYYLLGLFIFIIYYRIKIK